MLDVLVDRGLEMSTTENEQTIQTFTPDSSDQALSEGVCTGSPNRSSDYPDATGGEDLVESGCELGVAITDQELDRPGSLCEFIGQISGPAGRPRVPLDEP